MSYLDLRLDWRKGASGSWRDTLTRMIGYIHASCVYIDILFREQACHKIGRAPMECGHETQTGYCAASTACWRVGLQAGLVHGLVQNVASRRLAC